MPLAQFAVLETTSSAAGLTEANGSASGTNAAPGSTQCLAVTSDGSLAAGAGRGWLYFEDTFSALDATSEVYIDRNASGVTPFLVGRVPLQINPNYNLSDLDGYTIRLDSDGAGTIMVERIEAGVSTASASSSPASYTPTNGTWERWRVKIEDVGADVSVKVEKWNGSAWSSILSWLDTASPFNGQPGSFGFGVLDRAGGSIWPGPVIRFDDWRCDEIL